MHKFNVLIASRSRSAAEMAYGLLSKHGQLSTETRIISNGCVDPLYGLEELPDLLVIYDHNVTGELETLQKLDPESRPQLLVFGPGDETAVLAGTSLLVGPVVAIAGIVTWASVRA